MRLGDVLADRFEIASVAGSGGMSIVYRARDRHTDSAVAIKVMRGSEASDVERFQREARLVAELQHPGIVRYVAHGTTPGGERYLAMEWLEGTSVAQRIDHDGFTLAEAVSLVARIAEILSVAHRRNIVHRDLKPSNLYLVGNDVTRVKVLDFGIAKPAMSSSRVTLTGVMLGTPSFMSPEQARGMSDVDARADVYALGCLLFLMIAGRTPFSAADPIALLARVAVEPAAQLRTIRPDIPASLDTLVARMLSKDPTNRPRDAGALCEELATIDLPFEGAQHISQRPVALTRTERRLTCTIMSGEIDREDGEEFTDPRMNHAQRDATASALNALITQFGGRAELISGFTHGLFSTTGSATDLALRAARCALAMRELTPRAGIAIATSWGDDTTRRPSHQINDRAFQLLMTGHRRIDPRVATTPHVVIDEVTAGLLDTRFDVHVDDTYFELRAERLQTIAVRTFMGRPSPFLGREREIATLRGLFEECCNEPVARAAVVIGPAGVGKSRLRFELLREVSASSVPPAVWIARGDPISAGSPFGLLAPLVRQIAGVVDGEPPETQRSRLRARVSRTVAPSDRARVTEFLAELIGLPTENDPSVQIRIARRDALLMNDQMRRAWEDLLRAECHVQPVLLVLEDLHWGDLPTVKFVDAALRALADQPFMVLAFARPELHDAFPGLWREREVQEIRLAPLTRRVSERLVRDALGDQVDPEIVARLVEHCGGNALFLEELVRAVVAGTSDRLPATVLAMVQERIEGLDVEGRRVLRAASVFGQVFWRGGLASLLGGGEATPDLDHWLEHLVDREMIFRRGEGRFRGETEYAFRHALLREGAYGMLTDRDRPLGHRLAAVWLERAGEHQARVLAEHFERGDNKLRAAWWYLGAAEQAWEANDFGAIVDFAVRGTTLDSSDPVITGRMRRLAAEAHRWRGEYLEAERSGYDAMRLLAYGSPAWCAAAGETAASAGRLAHDEPLFEVTELLTALEPEPESVASFVTAATQAIVPLLSAGHVDRAELLLQHTLRHGEPYAADDLIVAARLLRVRGYRGLIDGDTATYLRLTDQAVEAFSKGGASRDACSLRAAVGYAYGLHGRYDEAERILREALAITEQLGLTGVAPVARHNLGWVLACAGKLAEGLAVENHAVAEAAAFGDRRVELPARIYLAQICAMMGDHESARRELTELLEHANPSIRAVAQGALARVLLAQSRNDEALHHATEAYEALMRMGRIEDGEARIRLAYAEALHANGSFDAAREAIASARERLVERAAKISDTALREGFLEFVAEHIETMARARQWAS